MQTSQFLINPDPKFLLLLRVLNMRYFLSLSILYRDISNLIPSLAILLIGKTNMILIISVLDIKQSSPNQINILFVFGEPRHLNWAWELCVDTDRCQFIY